MASTIHPPLYIEDFQPGQIYVHRRGRTVTADENNRWTLATLNTAEAHFNLDRSLAVLDGAFSERLVMGGFVLALIIGLTTEDMAENAIADVGLREVRFRSVVYPGDTLYARSEVLEVRDADRPEAGILSYLFTGSKSDGVLAVEGVRDVLLPRREPTAR